MRATNLQFRSPKEYTPASYDVKVTKEGTALQLKKRPISAKGTFPKESRFMIFRELARRVPREVGPGSYHCKNWSLAETAKEKGTLTYKKLHQERLDGNDGAFIVGSLMLYEERFSTSKSRLTDASPKPQTARTAETQSTLGRNLNYASQLPKSTATLPTLQSKIHKRRLSKSLMRGELRKLLSSSRLRSKRKQSPNKRDHS